MALLSDGSSIAVGLLIAACSGILNGSWNVSFSPTHGLAVGRVNNPTTANENSNGDHHRIDLSYHHAWILFQIYAAVINIPICILWAGGIERVNYIVREASGTSVALVVVFSVLWGVGSVGFGLACKIAGVGLGTNLCMGVIMVLGTFLPLCMDKTIGTPSGGVVLGGLAVCCVGLLFSIRSLQTRDVDEKDRHIRRRTMFNTTISLKKLDDTEAEETATNHDERTPEADSSDSEQHLDARLSATSADQRVAALEMQPSTVYKVAVCVIAGLFATQLQFAFVFGRDMIDLAADSERGPGSTPTSGTTAVIWLFAISLGAPVSIVYGLCSSPPDTLLSCMWNCPLHRHLLILLTTSIPWVTHIHSYGFATTFLPSEIAASVAWPIVMMMTAVAGILWSVALGEWNEASSLARRYLYMGLIIVIAGIGIIMASVGVQ